MCEQHKKKKNNLEDWCKEKGREDILKEWDTEKNRELLGLEVWMISYGNGKKAWWLCEQGHSYLQAITNKTNGNGCPYCANKKILKGYNDLTTTHPELCKEWDTEKNRKLLGLEIDKVSKGSDRKVWWLCKERHSYEQIITNKINGNTCPYCSGKKVLKGFNDLATTHPGLIEEWDYKKNKITPEEITAGSNKRVHWVCKINKDHKWGAKISNRTSKNKTGCPHCSNRGTSFPEQYLYYVLKSKFKEVSNREVIDGLEYDIFIKGINLLIEYDGIYYHRVLSDRKSKEVEKEEKAIEKGYGFIRVKESNKVKEIKMKDNIIRYKYKNNIEDINEILGLIIEYINSKYNFNIGKGIPEDAEQKARELAAKEQYENSLEVTHPELCKEWDYEKNKALKPSQVSSGSNIKVYWLCKEGHSYEQVINSKTFGLGCPYCSNKKVLKGYNDLATTKPELIEEWDSEKNKELLKLEITEVTVGTEKKAWWKCEKGHSYEQIIFNKTKGISCPYCSGRYPIIGETDLETTNPEILKHWDYKKNKIKPEEVSKGSGKKIWWLCLDNPEHSYQKKVQQMVKSQSCPICRKEKRN